MTQTNEARDVLKQVDREQAIAQWAEGLMCSIRLGRPINVSEMHQRGPFGRKRKYLYELDERMPHDAIEGLYRALLIVRNDSEAKASELNSKVTIRDNGVCADQEETK